MASLPYTRTSPRSHCVDRLGLADNARGCRSRSLIKSHQLYTDVQSCESISVSGFPDLDAWARAKKNKRGSE
jgi:hypothetical protein